jgi:GNAT superfamily N-acetyltransferase
MSAVRVRPFARSDRDQLTDLVNAHLSAVTPGASVSVQALLSTLEREPGEFIVDPWVTERRTLVAEQRQRVVAAAQLLRYGDSARVGESYRGSGEIRWLVCWPPAPFWPDAAEAGQALVAGCLAQLDSWQVRRSYADGSLPGPGVYGVPEQWPHIAALFDAAGFAGGWTEDVLIATTEQLLRQPVAPATDLHVSRTLGINGTRFTASSGDSVLGYIEIDTNLGDPGRFSRGAGLADVGNLHVLQPERHDEIAGWLLRQAAEWLELGGIGRLLTYARDDDADAQLWTDAGFRRLTTTRRMLERTPPPG